MADDVRLARLAATDLRAYKALRDEMLSAYPEAFTSDAETEGRRRADDYLPRLGLERPGGGHLTLGAWQGAALVGAIGLERDPRIKVRHIGHVVGMMVRAEAQDRGIGHGLLAALIEEARASNGLEMLTLTVTDTNQAALHLYERAGFSTFGVLRNAIKVDGRYHDKTHMVLVL
jgi:RimJ/RimL family protein N-acetyltransferase